jgi:hypothetical protein
VIIAAGLDLGKQNDYSALVIAEAHGTMRARRWGDFAKIETLPLTAVNVRHAERYPLGTKYHDVAAATGVWMRSLSQPRFLAVDHTGIGIPVAEIFEGLTPAAWITLTSGSGSRQVDSNIFHVAKKDLIAVGQVALEQRVLKIAGSLAHASAIESELRSYVGKTTQHGNLTYEAQREGDHDDLVCALCMAIWIGKEALTAAETREQDAFDNLRAQKSYTISNI